MKRIALLLFALSLALPAAATDFASNHLLIPIAGRAPGAFGSEWRTDLVVTNAKRNGVAVPVILMFTRDDGSVAVLHTSLGPRASLVLKDAIREFIGDHSAQGMITVFTEDLNAKLAARARIYNAGAANGEYGQTVQGMPVTRLSRDAYLSGLSGVNGNRTNVGISNPSPRTSTAFVSIFDAEGNFAGGVSHTIAPRSVLRLNDIFAHFDDLEPFDGATVQITSSEGVYAWASVIRNDTGDGDFVTGTGVEINDDEVPVLPQCESPAKLILSPRPAEGWIVIFHPGTNAVTTTSVLAAKYGFTPRNIFEHSFPGFSADGFSQGAIAALRCEAAVKTVEQNTQVFP
jgi:hypothetical protein